MRIDDRERKRKGREAKRRKLQAGEHYYVDKKLINTKVSTDYVVLPSTRFGVCLSEYLSVANGCAHYACPTAQGVHPCNSYS